MKKWELKIIVVDQDPQTPLWDGASDNPSRTHRQHDPRQCAVDVWLIVRTLDPP